MTAETARESVLLQFENAIGATLPDAYRIFLVSTGGETPKMNSFPLGSGVDAWETEVSFFGLQTGAYCLHSVPENFKEYAGRIPHHLVPIGIDPGGNLICLSIAEDRCGQIFFADHDYFSYDGDEPTDDGVEFLASSFESFFGSLRDYSDEWK
ncbi:hypothetical protein GCM10027277_56630 [Pseudoduganella ginsengisoli]|uniref:SMI1/KNR4 family protein n=1 Tax=Pseudoduganella ginsengisoli TaxID=1462440 RepID=UPI0012D3B46C